MTCVVGIEAGAGRVVLGADSASVSGATVLRSATAKAFTAHGIGYACAGSWRLINILRHSFVPPEHPEDCAPDEYLVVHWTAALRAHLTDVGALKKNSEVHGTNGGQALIAYRGGLYMLDSDFQIARDLPGYMAAGAGRDYALGSMATTATLGLSAARRVALALEAAAEHNYAVRGPMVVVEVGA